MKRSEVQALQRDLNASGHGPLVVDGRYGPRTAEAYRRLLTESDALGRGNPAPAPVADRPWWTHPAVIAGASALLSSALGIDSDPISQTLQAVIGLVAGAVAVYAAFTQRSAVDRGLLLPGYRPGVDGMRALPASVAQPAATKRDQIDNQFL
jgi:peptidoglycan hydrolase-like protein with peptidoglycan-binding domain